MITVVFSKDGFHHVSVGRLGTRDAQKGMPYQLPDSFANILPDRTRIFDPDNEKDQADLEDILDEFGMRRPARPQIVDQEALDSLTRSHAQRTASQSTATPEPASAPEPEPETQSTPRQRRRRQAA